MDNILKKLNSFASEYYYTCEDREYIHSTTFVVLAYKLFKPSKVSIVLKKSITSGFYFDTHSDEKSVGHILLNNCFYYIKQNDALMSEITISHLSEQQRLINLQNSITSAYYYTIGKKIKLWSRRLDINCEKIFETNLNNFNLDIKSKLKFTVFELKINNIISWEQYAYSRND